MLWATDLSIRHSEHVSLTGLLYYMSNGIFDPIEHVYTVPPSPVESKQKSGRRPIIEKEENLNRFAIMSSKLFHTNLAVIHYSVFFQTCRALGIGYDIKVFNFSSKLK